MRSKIKILKDIQEQIDNLSYVLVDDELDTDFPKDVKDRLVSGHVKRLKELIEIKKRLGDLLI